MKLSHSWVPAALLAGIITLAGFASAVSGTNPQNSLSTLQASSLQQAQDNKEFLTLADKLRQGLPLSAGEKSQYETLATRFKREHQGGTIDNSGGPDGFGYAFIDNQGGDTATYNWRELRGDANATWITFNNSHDDDVSAIPIGFTFPFYGSNFTNVTVSTNGNLQFASNATDYINGCLPASEFSGPTICVYWDDLHLDYGGIGAGANTVGYRNFGEYTVIEWDSVGHCCSAGSSYKFEAILYADGRIKLQYDNLVFGTYANSQTIGIQQSASGTALQYDCEASGPQPLNDLCIWFAPAESGTIRGTVRDDSDTPLPYARVVIEGTTLESISDNLGEFSFPIVAVGTFSLTASRSGHESQTLNDVVVVENQTTTADFNLTYLGLLVFTSADVPIAIPETGTATSTLIVDTSVPIADLDVQINITHSYDSDLTLSLTSPAGTTMVLCAQNGGSGDNFVNTIFDDEAGQSIADGIAPFTGSYRPDSVLSYFDNELTAGTWTFTAVDDAPGDDGSIDGWEIMVTPAFVGGGTLAGTILTSSVNLPIVGATVTIPDLNESASTNLAGGFTLTHLPAGTYSVVIQAEDHCDSIVTNVTIVEEQTTTLNVSLLYATASFSVTSISQSIFTGGNAQSEFTIGNGGNCALDYSISDASAWLSESPDDGFVLPNGQAAITVNFSGAGLNPGTYTSLISVIHRASGSPFEIPVTLDVVLAGDEPGTSVPTEFAFHGNFPNPFNATTELRFDIPRAAHVKIALYNIIGQEIRTLLYQTLDAGRHVTVWDGRDARGLDAATGLYIVRMTADDYSFTNKLMLLK